MLKPSPMATLTFQRAPWSSQVLAASRLFAVSFTSSLPRRRKALRLPSDLFNPSSPAPRISQFHRPSLCGKTSTHSETRRAFSSTRSHYAQQSEASSPTAAKAGLHAQPSSTPETISPNATNLSGGLNDQNLVLDEGTQQVDWTRSFHGLSIEAFSPEAAKILLAPIDPEDIEVKPDGILYLPEIKYRRILNQAFGPGGWGLAPRGETIVTAKAVTREYALVVLGRYLTGAVWRSTLQEADICSSGLSLLPEANRIISHRRVFLLLLKDANQRRCVDVAKIWE